MRLRTTIKVTAVVLLAVVLLVWGAYGLTNHYWSSQIAARAPGILAAGSQSKPVRERDNAAPIYRQVAEVMSSPSAKQDLSAIYPILYPSRAPRQAEWTNAKAALSRCDKILSLIKEAQSKPRCRFAAYPLLTDVSTKSIYRQQAAQNRRLETELGLRDAARLLSAAALIGAREKNAREAVTYTQSALKISDATRENGTLVDYLAGESTVEIALNNMRQTLSICQLTESQLRQLDSALSCIDSAGLYRTAIENERAYFLKQNYQFSRNGMPMTPIVGNGDTLAYIDFLTRHLQSTRMNYRTALSKGLAGPRACDGIPSYAVLTKILAPVMARAADLRYRCEAQAACARAVLALLAYRERFGRYPRTLSEVQSKMGWKIPPDPFTGGELVYLPISKGFALYSVAYDLRDDGGRPISWADSSAKGDIAWRVMR